MNFKLFLNKNSGFSLVEVMVALGISMVVLSGVTTMIVNSSKETQVISETLGKLDLEKLLIASLSDGKICSKVLLGKTFNATTLQWAPPLALTALPASDQPGAPNLIAVGSTVSPMSATLKVGSIDFTDIANNSATPASTSYRASIKITFTGSLRSMKALTLQTTLTTDNNVTTKTVLSCLGAGAAGFGTQDFLAKWSSPTQVGTSQIYENPGTGNIGIGNVTTGAKMSIGPTLNGTALSTTMVTNAGALGGAAGNMLSLANFGFTSGNNSSLGIKALRTANGASWNTTAIGLSMDVDNTSPVNNSQVWMASNGSVGVGTSSPKSKLHIIGGLGVGGSVNATGTAIELSTDTTFGGVHNDHTGIRLFAYDMNGWKTAKLGVQVSDNWSSYWGGNAPAKTDMALVVGLDETLVRGNLGIGVGTTSAKLDLATGGGWGGNWKTQQKAFRIFAPDTNFGLSIIPYVVGAGNVGYHFSPNVLASQNDGMIIDSVGKVGIGTAGPMVEKFEVNGNARFGNYNNGIGNVNAFSLELGGQNPSTNNKNATLYFNHQGVMAHQLRYNNGALFLEAAGSGGYTTNATPILNVGGGIIAGVDMTSPAYFYSSDRRLKENIEPLQSILDKVTQIQAVHFKWKKDGRPDIGFIAQDVESKFPELVKTSPNDGLKSVEYGNMTALTFQAIRELKERLESAEKKIAKLEKENQQLVQKVDKKDRK